MHVPPAMHTGSQTSLQVCKSFLSFPKQEGKEQYFLIIARIQKLYVQRKATKACSKYFENRCIIPEKFLDMVLVQLPHTGCHQSPKNPLNRGNKNAMIKTKGRVALGLSAVI